MHIVKPEDSAQDQAALPSQTDIKPEHLPVLSRAQHVLEWLIAEKTRLETELAHVISQGQRMEGMLGGILRQQYNISGQYELDVEKGLIFTPAQKAEMMAKPAPDAGDDKKK